MALAYLTEGSPDLTASAWSDATGFADDATLIVEKGTQAIVSSLTAGSGLTNGISYIHFRSGFTGVVGGPAGALETKYHSTYSAKPNVILDGGTLYLTNTNTAAWILVLSGTLYLVSGTTTLLEQRGGIVHRSTSAVVTTLDKQGGEFRDLGDNTNAITTGHVVGSAWFRSTVTTLNIYEDGNVTSDYTTGPTTVNMYGGRCNLLRGGATTINGRRGILDVRMAGRDQTISTLNQWPKFRYLSAGAANTTTVSSTVPKVGGAAEVNDSI